MLSSTAQTQQGMKLVTTNNTNGTSSQEASSGGDQVTISKEGKELASARKGVPLLLLRKRPMLQ
jgi:hypothetical protein